MNSNNYLPSDNWMADAKKLIKDPAFLVAFGKMGLIALPALPFVGLLGPFFWYVIWGPLIKYFIDEQRKRKIKAILEGFPGKYEEKELETLSQTNTKEFNRLVKLASDEFFRKFVQEQADHRKAQELIANLQKRIDDMRERLAFMQKKEDKHREEIEMLRVEIATYSEILENWQRKAA